MARFKPYSYDQLELIPVSFSRQILPGTFEHSLIDHELDTSIFHSRFKNDDNGRPAYDPAILLKIVLLAYSRGVTSSRKIEQLCQENVLFMAISANTQPHFTTIAEFISSSSEAISHWIWRMADEEYPGAIQILDFFHVSEYVWDVARTWYPDQPEAQKAWVEPQLQLLKESKWQDVVGLDELKARPPTKEVALALESYLTNNASRLDYKRYLDLGLMIGSGVVESSNRRIVTVRLKQSGMHWSAEGANGVMALRACYLSSSNRWRQVWERRTA